ncbi:unnamed protein product [Amoebophrya sp. A120]|nr:unnamed protein product [Amoebophrya sp. A120]|eukprot:GSA120T00000849001.1
MGKSPRSQMTRAGSGYSLSLFAQYLLLGASAPSGTVLAENNISGRDHDETYKSSRQFRRRGSSSTATDLHPRRGDPPVERLLATRLLAPQHGLHKTTDLPAGEQLQEDEGTTPGQQGATAGRRDGRDADEHRKREDQDSASVFLGTTTGNVVVLSEDRINHDGDHDDYYTALQQNTQRRSFLLDVQQETILREERKRDSTASLYAPAGGANQLQIYSDITTTAGSNYPLSSSSSGSSTSTTATSSPALSSALQLLDPVDGTIKNKQTGRVVQKAESLSPVEVEQQLASQLAASVARLQTSESSLFTLLTAANATLTDLERGSHGLHTNTTTNADNVSDVRLKGQMAVRVVRDLLALLETLLE